jgi:uncharacterized membrane protein
MVYCSQCGTQFEGRFCPSCGAPAGAAAGAGATAAGLGTPPPSSQEPFAPGLASNWASVLCYVVLIVGPVIFLFLAPYNRDRKIRFDAWQALFLQIAYCGAFLVIGIITGFSYRANLLLDRILELAYFALVVFMAVKAFQNQKVVLPVVGPFAEKQK